MKLELTNPFKGDESQTQERQHLIPHEQGWAVKKEGAQRPTRTFDNKPEAMEYAVGVARHQKTTLVVHGQDGQIMEQRTY